MHAVCTSKNTNVDIFESDVAIDDTRNDDLKGQLIPTSQFEELRLTVGIAMP